MASLIPDFEYDIFISYRQKDNKGDRWVSEFVSHLKTEIEATFKEDISVYFDDNPDDRLLETHNVDKSLESKLKCLIFIPVISRTFCDPNSYAWQNELMAFRKMSMNDRFGTDVRLRNGNVASRILPIRIHDMDPEDKKLFEEATGGVMRAIDFVFKTSAGVNRPLLFNEDHPNENLNKTFYRDQINKVANAIKDIIQALGTSQGSEKDSFAKNLPEAGKGIAVSRRTQLRNVLINLKVKNRIIIAMAVLLIISGALLAYSLIFRNSERINREREKSIAVLIFNDFSGRKERENITEEITSEIISHLYKIKSFDKVVPLLSVLQYKGTAKTANQIAEELDVTFILEGSYRRTGNEVMIKTSLIDPENERILWENEYKILYREQIAIQADIALQIAGQVKAYITSSEKQNIKKVPTKNQEAYEKIQQGLYLWNTRSFMDIDQMAWLAQQAIDLDPEYADAYAFKGLLYLLKISIWGSSEINSVLWEATDYLEKALELDSENCNAHFGMALYYDWIRWDFVRAEKELKKILDLEPNNPQYLELYVEFLLKRKLPDQALKIKISTEQAYRLIQANILAGRNEETFKDIRYYLASYGLRGEKYAGDCFIWMGKYDSARFYLERAVKSDDPDMKKPRFQAYLALAYNKTGDYVAADKIINQLKLMSKVTTANSPEYFVGWYYMGCDKSDSAFIWLQKAFGNRSTQLTWLNADPVFKKVVYDERYISLYNQTGHSEYQQDMSSENTLIRNK